MIRIQILILCFAILFLDKSYAQLNWLKQIWSGTQGIGFAEDRRVYTDQRGNTYIAQIPPSQTEMIDGVTLDGSGFSISKVNRYGKLLWVVSADSSYGTECFQVYSDDKGFVYLTGFFEDYLRFDTIIFNTQGFGSAFVCKIDTGGDLIWIKCFSTSEFHSVRGYTVTSDFDGNVYVGGTFEADSINIDGTWVSNSSFDSTNCFVLKLNEDGEFQWIKTGIGAWPPLVYTYQSQLYVTAPFQVKASWEGMHLISNFGLDFFIMRWSLDGDMENYVNSSGNLQVNPGTVNITPTGSIYVLCFSESNFSFDSTNINTTQDSSAMILKLSSDLNLQWAKGCFTGSYSDTIHRTDFSLATDNEDQPHFFWRTDSSFIVIIDTMFFSYPIHYKGLHELILNSLDGSEISEKLYDVYLPPQINIYLDSLSNVYGYSSFWSDYNVEDTIFESGNYLFRLGSFELNTYSPFLIKNSSIDIFPNPTTTTITFKLSDSKANDIIVYNILGEEVMREHVAQPLSSISLNITSLASGTYLIAVRDKEKVFTSNFIKE